MVITENELERWSILDKATNTVFDLTDVQFNEGLSNNFIKLTGQFILVENKHKIWIDGVCTR